MLGQLNTLVTDKLFKPPGGNRCRRPGGHVSKRPRRPRGRLPPLTQTSKIKSEGKTPPSTMRRGTSGDVSDGTTQVKPACAVRRVMSDGPSPASAFLHQEK